MVISLIFFDRQPESHFLLRPSVSLFLSQLIFSYTYSSTVLFSFFHYSINVFINIAWGYLIYNQNNERFQFKQRSLT